MVMILGINMASILHLTLRSHISQLTVQKWTERTIITTTMLRQPKTMLSYCFKLNLLFNGYIFLYIIDLILHFQCNSRTLVDYRWERFRHMEIRIHLALQFKHTIV